MNGLPDRVPVLMRMLLVVSQFAYRSAWNCRSVVFSQITSRATSDLGFERDGVVIIRGITKTGPKRA